MNRARASITSVFVAFAITACGGGGGGKSSGGSGGNNSGGSGGSQSGGSGGSQKGGSGGSETGGSGGSEKGGAGGSEKGGSGGSEKGGSGGSEKGGSGGSGKGGATTTTPGKGGAIGGNTTGGNGGAQTGGVAGAIDGGSDTASGSGGGPPGVTVQLDKTFQTIQGFGINDALMGPMGTSAINTIFDTSGSDGLGLSILRVGMESGGGLTPTSASSDITAARAKGAKIIGSCWSPPGSWKSGQPQAGSENGGGHVNPDKYTDWANRIATFAQSNGLDAMSIGNEPDFASCGTNEPCNGDYATTLYTAKELVAFLKVAGPIFRSKAPNTKIIVGEASEWIHQWSNLSATGSVPGNKPSSDPLKCGCFGNIIAGTSTANCASKCASGDGYDYGHWLAKDTTAWGFVDIIGVHEYDAQRAEPWPADITGGKRDKEIWQTEMSGVKWWPEQGTGTGSSLKGSTTIENGVAVAGWIHDALVVGEASAWLYWWYQAYNTDDNEGLLLATGSGGAKAKRYYTLGNYSKFVRPGYVMVGVAGNSNADVLLSAFKGTDATVVVAINKGKSAATVPIAITGGTAPASCTPNVTSSNDNLKAGTAVTVTGGTFTASLASQTVTTFVCK
jgi:glucuronoarabinoxylan endo-1,4-beta-xylanase